MPRITDVKFSRESTVSAVRDFYQFLAKLYLPPSSIIEPPEGGWPDVTQENLADLGKTDEVIDLLRHLPYIRDDGENDTPQVAPGTCFVDWSRLATRQVAGEDILLATEGDEWNDVPSHVVGLALEARWAFNFNLDTKLGIIHWVKCPSAISREPSVENILDNPEDYAPENELSWRCEGPAWEITDLFKQLKSEFEQLNFVPTGTKEVVDDYSLHSGESGDGSTDAMREVYRAHGWPDAESYRKKECLKALRVMLAEKYPELLDEDDD